MSPIRRRQRGVRRATIAPTIAVALIVSLAGTATAQATKHAKSQPLPINIKSNNADFSQKSGVSTYTGDVSMTRGGLTLTGNKLVVTRINDRSQIKAVLTGNPAHIDKKPDATNKDTVTGHARRIEYSNGASVITLRGNAEVDRNGDQVRGAVITHNVDTGATHAERGKGQNERVHITIQPNSGGR